jgi:hypothetical protein
MRERATGPGNRCAPETRLLPQCRSDDCGLLSASSRGSRMRKGTFEKRCLPARHDREAAAQEGVQAELANDEGGVGEHVPRSDDAADRHGYEPDESMGLANGDSVSRMNESPIGIDRFMDSSLASHRVPRTTRPERRKGYSAGNKVAVGFRASP